MADLDLKELDRLEKEMQGKVMSTNVNDIHEQLRPLLDLVDEMGEALERVETVLGPTVPQCGCDGCEVEMQESLDAAEDGLAGYRRARGGKQ